MTLSRLSGTLLAQSIVCPDYLNKIIANADPKELE